MQREKNANNQWYYLDILDLLKVKVEIIVNITYRQNNVDTWPYWVI